MKDTTMRAQGDTVMDAEKSQAAAWFRSLRDDIVAAFAEANNLLRDSFDSLDTANGCSTKFLYYQRHN